MSKISQSEALQIILDVWQDISQAEGVDEAQAMRYALESAQRVAEVFERRAGSAATEMKPELPEHMEDPTDEDCFIDAWRYEERPWPVGWTPGPYGPCGSVDLYKAYRRWCHYLAVEKPSELNKFLEYVGKLPGWESKPLYRYENADYTGALIRVRMVIPAGFSQPEGKTKSQWLTDCHFAFTAALHASENAA